MEEAQEYGDTQPMATPVYAGHATEGSLRYQIDNDDIIREVEHSLKAEILTFKDGSAVWYRPANVKPLINDAGVNNILVVLRSHLSKVFSLSDLDERTIQHMTLSIGRDFIEDLRDNWEIYEIKDSPSASHITRLITNTVYATLRKGYNARYLNFLRSTQSIQEVQHRSIRDAPHHQLPANEDPGIFNKLFGRKRR